MDIAAPKKITKEYLAAIQKQPLESVAGDIVRMAKDQHGCRFLQKKLDEVAVPQYGQRQHHFEVIFSAVYGHMYELIIDPFGNYLVQKMVGYCGDDNLNVVLDNLQHNLFQISINQHGTRALQKIIDACHLQGQLQVLIHGLSPYIIDLIKDLNGNHVIQKILNKFGPEDCQFIYDAIITDLGTVATHKHGCCVLQKCLNHVTPPQLGQFSAAILAPTNFAQLINDQFGNYVVQYLISINSGEINQRVFANFVRAGVAQLCNLKFSSNVVEKFLKNCYANEVADPRFASLKFDLIYHILIYDLNKLINDPYGNYVVQTLIDIVINPHVQYLGPQGQFLIDKLALLLPQGYGLDDDTLQIAIIKTWFQKCKIVSSFGKRIQSKINIILNNSARSQSSHLHQQPMAPGRHFGQRSSSAPHPALAHHVAWAPPSASAAPSAPLATQAPWLAQGSYAVNMTANGEFVADYSLPPSRSLSVSSSIAGGAPSVVSSDSRVDGAGAGANSATGATGANINSAGNDYHVGGHARQVSMASSTDTAATLGHRSQSSISSLSGGSAPLAPVAPYPQPASAYTVSNPLASAASSSVASSSVWHPSAPAHHPLLAPSHHYGMAPSELLAPSSASLAMTPMTSMAPSMNSGLAPGLAPNLGTGYHHRHPSAFDQSPLFP